MPVVLAETRGKVAIVTLNRPEALNALNEEMLLLLTDAFNRFANDDRVDTVVLRSASTRAFCAGGDIRAVRDHRDDRDFMDHIYRIEYELDYLIHTFPKPVVALINGIVMGGGCGISLHARYRIATPDLVFAMPETGIGFFPDIGGSVFLGRLPPGIGTYLGMTGARLDAGEALHLGLIDKVVDQAQYDLLIEALASGMSAEDAVAVAQSAPLPEADISTLLTVSRTFDHPSALDIVHALEREQTEAASQIAASLRRRCPFSLEITVRLIAMGRRWSLRDALAIDFRIAQRFMERQDYFEGVRAVLVDRDNAPAWEPARQEDVDLKEVEACFAPLARRELWPLSAEAARDLP